MSAPVLHRLFAPDAPAHPGAVRVDGDTVEILDGSEARLVAGRGRPRKLVVVDVGGRPVANLPAQHPPSLVYADRFSLDDIAELRRRHWCGIDRSGQVVVVSPSLTISVERPGLRPAGTERDTVPKLRGRSLETGTAGVRGLATARLTQLLLESPGRAWRPTDLARVDARSTVATASRLLAELRRLGLLAVRVERQSKWYSVLDPMLLLRWLADRTPALDRRSVLDGYIRTRSFDGLVDRILSRLGPLEGRAVFTGSAAATLDSRRLTTSIPFVALRIDPAYELAAAAADLALAVGGPSPNVRLLRDAGYVGLTGRRLERGVPLAGVVRTWLDIRQERRGVDAAELYLDVVADAIQPATASVP
jgi:hypothetical protein